MASSFILIKIKQVAQKGLSFFGVLVFVVPGLVVALIRIARRFGFPGPVLRLGFRRRGTVLRLRNRSGSRLGGRPLDDLIQLPPVQPDPPALGAIVDLHPLPLGHIQSHITNRTIHKQISIKNVILNNITKKPKKIKLDLIVFQ
jgi:hypothetical protein